MSTNPHIPSPLKVTPTFGEQIQANPAEQALIQTYAARFDTYRAAVQPLRAIAQRYLENRTDLPPEVPVLGAGLCSVAVEMRIGEKDLVVRFPTTEPMDHLNEAKMRILALSRAALHGVTRLEQPEAWTSEDEGVVITKHIQSASATSLTPAEIVQIPLKHIHELAPLARQIALARVSLDTCRDTDALAPFLCPHGFYDNIRGFSYIDFSIAEETGPLPPAQHFVELATQGVALEQNYPHRSSWSERVARLIFLRRVRAIHFEEFPGHQASADWLEAAIDTLKCDSFDPLPPLGNSEFTQLHLQLTGELPKAPLETF